MKQDIAGLKLKRLPTMASDLQRLGLLSGTDLAGAEPFVLDDVAAWEYGRLESEDKNTAFLKTLAGLSCRPPFGRVWAEWRTETRGEMGCLVDETALGLSFRIFSDLDSGRGDFSEVGRVVIAFDETPSGWMLPAEKPRMKLLPYVDRKYGDDPAATERVRKANAAIRNCLNDFHVKYGEGMAWRGVLTCLAAFMLLNCANIEAAEATYNRTVRRHSLGGGEPTVRYRVLCINVPNKQSSSSGSGFGQGMRAMRLHDVRGHMARYTEDAPLFGRYVGAFWIPNHQRGDVERGAVAKTYRMEMSP